MKHPKKPKVVILAGGRGMRLQEETEYRPKPLIQVGPYPILLHIMRIYMRFGFNEFVICLGYKGEMIKEYFLNYETFNNDITLNFSQKCKLTTHKSKNNEKFSVTLVDTGLDTMTAGRVKLIKKYIDEEDFFLTYGDGVADIDIAALYQFHLTNKHIATVTGVHSESRFGELVIKDINVQQFSEKPALRDKYINGGFFVFKKQFFDYLDKFDDCYFEKEPMQLLTKDKQLAVYKHTGFWQCMDTYKDFTYLDELWDDNAAPWADAYIKNR